jgi:hydrogenase maturation protein HypF
VLALGALLKNTVALAVGSDVFVSQHIGDLENHEALIAHERVVIDFLRMYGATPAAVAVDLHPDSQGRDLAARARSEPPLRSLEGAELVTVQHHHAHLAACLADNQSIGPALGVIFDGTGFGADGTIWGGEFLLGDARGYERVAHLRPFRLPGGDAAVQEPRRVALALLFELELASNESALSKAFTPEERTALLGMLARGFNAPITTSAGRLFDAVASLTGVRHKVRFEAQAAIELEQLADLGEREPYPMVVRPGPARALWLDWEPLILALLADRARGVPPSIMAARLHEGLARGVFDVVLAVGASRVALSGGCFQNRLLLDRCQRKLGEAGIEVLVHRQVPPNDACIAVGQVAVASAALG